jgi:Mn-dependent DtxR family transcriptional regulator
MATSKAKAVNYTPANIETMKEMYTGKDNTSEVKAIAAALGKTPNSVRAKLAAEGLYVVAKKAATGSARTKKATIVADIAKRVGGLEDFEQEGLEKATAAPLQKILDALVNSEKSE